MVIRAGLMTSAALVMMVPAIARADTNDCAARLTLPKHVEGEVRRAITAADLIELRDFGRTNSDPKGAPPFAVSPDGRRAATILRRADVSRNTYCFGVALIALDGSGQVSLADVGGDFIEASGDSRGIPDIPSGVPLTPTPLWSLDGQSLFYLRRDGGLTQIWQAFVDGRPARQITHLATDVRSLAIAKDGTTLLLTTRPSLDIAKARLAAGALSGFHYDARFWTLNEAKPRPAVPLPFTYLALRPDDGTLRELSASDAEALKLQEAPWRKSGPGLWAESPSGSRAWTDVDDPSLILAKPTIRLQLRGNQRSCPPGLCEGEIDGIWWVSSSELLVLKGGGPDDAGRLSLYRWDSAGRTPPIRVLITNDALIGCQLWNAQLLCAHESATSPRDLIRVSPRTGRFAPIATFNPEYSHIRLGSVMRVAWTNLEGLRTYGDLVLPPGHRRGEKHPLVVVQYTSRGFLRGGTGNENPIYLLAEHGFAVLSFQQPDNLPAAARVRDITELQKININGWAGRRSIYSALDKGIDAAIADGAIDPERIGISGMSDGSTTTQFALLNSTRFKAAAIGSCCDERANLFIAGPAFRDAILSWGYPGTGDDGARFWAPMSLAANAARVNTPLLIQVPDFEYRGALETQSALEQARAPVDMYVFPDEFHVKSGPAHLDAIYRRTLGWFEFWLIGKVSEPGPLSDEIKRWDRLRSSLARR